MCFIGSSNFYFYFNICWLAMACVIFVLAIRFKAPYGRHTSAKWGPLMDNKSGWFLMELPALLLPIYCCLTATQARGTVVWILLFAFCFHYFNRVVIFPLRIKTKGKKIPVIIVVFALIFNLFNGLNIGYFLGNIARYSIDWLYDIRFIAGSILFITGMLINWKSDAILINLRKPGETGYKIPKGFLFEKISCPNHFGEIIEWIGFAILTWSLPALGFAVWTIANLIPRSLNHHKWYQDTFVDYPKDRKAVLPYVC